MHRLTKWERYLRGLSPIDKRAAMCEKASWLRIEADMLYDQADAIKEGSSRDRAREVIFNHPWHGLCSDDVGCVAMATEHVYNTNANVRAFVVADYYSGRSLDMHRKRLPPRFGG